MVPPHPISLTIARLHQSPTNGLTSSATHLCCSTLFLLGDSSFSHQTPRSAPQAGSLLTLSLSQGGPAGERNTSASSSSGAARSFLAQELRSCSLHEDRTR